MKRRIEFIGSVNDHVQTVELVKFSERNANLVRQVACGDRGGDTDDVQTFFGHPAAELKNRVFDGRTRSQADVHAVENVIARRYTSLGLESFNIHGWSFSPPSIDFRTSEGMAVEPNPLDLEGPVLRT